MASRSWGSADARPSRLAGAQGADIRFVANDIASETVLSAVDRFVVP